MWVYSFILETTWKQAHFFCYQARIKKEDSQSLCGLICILMKPLNQMFNCAEIVLLRWNRFPMQLDWNPHFYFKGRGVSQTINTLICDTDKQPGVAQLGSLWTFSEPKPTFLIQSCFSIVSSASNRKLQSFRHILPASSYRQLFHFFLVHISKDVYYSWQFSLKETVLNEV